MRNSKKKSIEEEAEKSAKFDRWAMNKDLELTGGRKRQHSMFKSVDVDDEEKRSLSRQTQEYAGSSSFKAKRMSGTMSQNGANFLRPSAEKVSKV